MRGQAYTLEGVLAAIVVVTATVYGLSAVDTGPFQTGSQQRTAELESRASDTLSLAAETGALHNATACYSVGTPTLNGNQTGSSTEFEMMLNQTFDRQGDQYNLYFSYWDSDSDARQTTIVSQETEENVADRPADAAVATETVTLTDDMPARIGDCSGTGPSLSTVDGYFAPDAESDSIVYNVVEVRLVVW
ncbi:DUF7288 family protein [Haloarcula amylolytica]|uniref:Uncharacterized protein n=1 Tax=Haloarcula amylolytica JCM 13557 TaxID=1227452 RepID=M0K4H7_9EURY|nr:hypothetical protein [Haloarcula amylolytica]EMA15718.1 hypothetical protein C442_19586 [Haloarcula amylolytica JCM 13557]